MWKKYELIHSLINLIHNLRIWFRSNALDPIRWWHMSKSGHMLPFQWVQWHWTLDPNLTPPNMLATYLEWQVFNPNLINLTQSDRLPSLGFTRFHYIITNFSYSKVGKGEKRFPVEVYLGFHKGSLCNINTKIHLKHPPNLVKGEEEKLRGKRFSLESYNHSIKRYAPSNPFRLLLTSVSNLFKIKYKLIAFPIRTIIIYIDSVQWF